MTSAIGSSSSADTPRTHLLALLPMKKLSHCMFGVLRKGSSPSAADMRQRWLYRMDAA